MSSTPPEQPTTPQQPSGGYGGPNVNLNLAALMPTPGNAELVVYILATIMLGIIALSSNFDANGFASRPIGEAMDALGKNPRFHFSNSAGVRRTDAAGMASCKGSMPVNSSTAKKL